MPRPPRTEPASRLNLVLTKSARDKLEKLRVLSKADSMTEVIRRALSVYDSMWQQKANGGKLLIKDKDGQRELVLL